MSVTLIERGVLRRGSLRGTATVALVCGATGGAGRSVRERRCSGIDPDRLTASRRMLARRCIDWADRRPHLPAALTGRLLELGWLTRSAGRSLRVAADYDQKIDAWLSLQTVRC